MAPLVFPVATNIFPILAEKMVKWWKLKNLYTQNQGSYIYLLLDFLAGFVGVPQMSGLKLMPGCYSFGIAQQYLYEKLGGGWQIT